MKTFVILIKAAILVGAVSALTTPLKQNVQKRADGLPSGVVVANGVAFGFLPSDGSATSPPYTMAQIDSTLGAKASTYGYYSQITSSTYDGSQLLARLSDVVSSGAVFQPAIMPLIPFSEVTSSVASQVASVLEQFTSQGVEVWLRFGHEMNYYVSSGEYSGTPAEFITAWQNIHAAVSSNSLIKMYWSPNIPLSTAEQYFPGSSYVDIVGIDCYPSSPLSSTAFSDCYSSFYETYSSSSGYNIPFAIGETGYCGSGGNDEWLAQLVGQDMCDYPNYIAASWFEFDKDSCDFRIVMGSSSTLAETKTLLLDNTGTGTSGCSGSTGTWPPDTCSWGCEGWDCSASSPCQSAYSCVGGYCSDCTWGCNGWDCSASQPCNADYTCVSGYCHHSGPATK